MPVRISENKLHCTLYQLGLNIPVISDVQYIINLITYHHSQFQN